MATGKIIWFNDFKGYGFIEDEKGRKFLAHPSALKGSSKKNLKAGAKVKFTTADVESTIADVDGLAKTIEIV